MRDDKKVEWVLLEKAVKATIQKLLDKRFFDNYDNADEELKDFNFLFEKRRSDLYPKGDSVNQ